ncbi:MAG TPA: hypothetical protein VHJ20_10720 [Polyangia bacterium]|nr:hypothetical protein [Polyangia bacterium]
MGDDRAQERRPGVDRHARAHATRGLAWTCYQALSEGPLLTRVLEIALASHLRALVALTRPGGRCLLVTDAVSTDTVALEESGDRAALLRRLDEEGALFSGTSPSLAFSLLARDPELAREVVDPFVVEPWVWRLAPRRAVLVYTLAFGRGGARDA